MPEYSCTDSEFNKIDLKPIEKIGNKTDVLNCCTRKIDFTGSYFAFFVSANNIDFLLRNLKKMFILQFKIYRN